MTDKILQFVPKQRGASRPTSIEAARTSVIDRVAKAIWDADGENTQPWPEWSMFVADAYEVGDPAMLEQVSDAYRRARAAIGALKPQFEDNEIAHRIAVEGDFNNPGGATHVVDQWIDEVLR